MPNCCSATDRHFGAKHAKRDLARYLKQGPDPTTSEMLTGIRSYGERGGTLLDVGGGIGIIHHELLSDVCSTAVHVDLSSEYLAAAAKESERRGHKERVQFVQADFAGGTNGDSVTVGTEFDIVTLDRVVCCYPEYKPLVERAVRQCRNMLALSYPRDSWYAKLGFLLDNLKRRLKGDSFRAYVHPVVQIVRIPEMAGFRLVKRKKMLFWQVDLLVRGNGISG